MSTSASASAIAVGEALPLPARRSSHALPVLPLLIIGVFAAAGTPKPIVDRLNRAMVAAIRKPELQEKMAKLGAEAVGSTPEEFGEVVRSEQAKWAKVIREAGIEAN